MLIHNLLLHLLFVFLLGMFVLCSYLCFSNFTIISLGKLVALLLMSVCCNVAGIVLCLHLFPIYGFGLKHKKHTQIQ